MQLNIHPDIRQAKTIHTDFYTKTDYFEAAKEKIFAQSWQFVGDTDRLNEVNIYPFTLLEHFLDEPLLLTKDKDETIRCLSNVCTHRGNLVENKPCNAGRLRCKYHGRIFGLDGKFAFMPEFENVENFPCEADHLSQLPLYRIGKLLFTALQSNLPTAPFFKAMIDRIGWMPLDTMQYRSNLSSVYHVDCNWALYCENYLEGFHIPYVHPSLSSLIDYCNYTTEIYEYCNLQLGVAKNHETCFDLPPSSPDYGKNIAAYYYWVFPNMMFNFYPWGLSLNLVEPLAIDRSKVNFLVYVWDESKLEKGAGAGLNQVEMEDEEVVQQVQRGVRSRYYTHGRYSPTREQGPHHFHSICAQFLQR